MIFDPLLKNIPATNEISNSWVNFGFRFGEKGTHTSRTIMFRELSMVLEKCPPDARKQDYYHAIVEENCLEKRTSSTRKLSYQRLRELYVLDPGVPLFKVLCFLWSIEMEGRSILALLTALARDPLLRVTASPVLRMRPGEELSRQQIADALRVAVGDRLNESTLDKVVRNTCSSWTQSRHLIGRGRKSRALVKPTPVSVTFALFLGFVMGEQGKSLFKSFWSEVLDSSDYILEDLAKEAKRLALLDFKQSGEILEISFERLLNIEERQFLHV